MQRNTAPTLAAAQRSVFLKRRTIFWLLVAAATMLGTFVLPFLFPLKVPVFSPAYTAGGNNRVGAEIAAAVSVIVSVLCWRFGFFLQPVPGARSENERPSLRWLWIGMGVVTLSAAVLGIQMIRLNMYYADAGYFLTQLRSGMVFHGKLYLDVEFAYGPLLYLWPAAFIRVLGAVHVSAMTAYVVSLCVIETAGTAMLFYTVSAMPMRRGMKVAAFAALCIVTLDPQEGLNYTAFRFVCAAASLVLLSRQRTPWMAAGVAAVAACFNFAVSPEMGVAFAASAIVYSAYRAWTYRAQTGEHRLLWIVPATLAGAGGFALLVGPDYFATLKEFANGGYNMLLEPAPHMYLLLICAVGLAPAVVASVLAGGRRVGERAPVNGLVLGTYITGLALLPAALGRCDPLHVSFNGWPVFLLSFIALDRLRLPARRIGVVVAFVFAVYSVVQEYALGSGPIRQLALQRPNPYEDIDLPRLQTVLRGERVATPWYTPMRNVDVLTAAGEYQPLYLCIAAVDDRAEQRTVRDMRRANYVLAPNLIPRVSQNAINNVGIKYRMRFGYRYKERHEPHMQGALLMQELNRNWLRVGTFGSYDLYRRERSPLKQ